MNSIDARRLLTSQRDYFHTGATLSLSFRKQMLTKLLNAVKNSEKTLLQALYEDLRKSEFEAYTNEIGLIYVEIKHMLKNLSKWAKPEKHFIELYLQPASGRLYREPYGNTLIIAPWNYPFQLLIGPLAAAIAAGNTAIVKPSEVSPATAKVMTEMLTNTFSPEFVAVVNGGVEETTELLKLPVDKIFFTGSVPVGKIVMEQAAKNLTPLTLELGGKSPVIVAADANLKLAAKKVVWGKFNNAGQTCVAPDYVLIDNRVKAEFLKLAAETIREFYGPEPSKSGDYGRIINERHTKRLAALIDPAKVVTGGEVRVAERYIAPTILKDISAGDPVMQDEIFGPILPVIGYENIEEAISFIRTYPKPLALYLFTSSADLEEDIMRRVTFGGGGINTTILHVASGKLPFGGVGHSGMGAYHGKAGFEEFSHRKSVLKQPSFFDPGITYPGKQIPLNLVKWLM